MERTNNDVDVQLLTTDPVIMNQGGNGRVTPGGTRNEINNTIMTQSGDGLSTFVNSEELRLSTEAVMVENRQLRAQLLGCLNAYKPRLAELDVMKKVNQQLKDEVFKCHEKSKVKVLSQNKKIQELQQQIQQLNEELRRARGGSPNRERASPPVVQSTPEGRPVTSPLLSPAGQNAYDKSMENVLEQLQAVQDQETKANLALAKERERADSLEALLQSKVAELTALKGSQASHVVAAVERQKQEDEARHQYAMNEMMKQVEELTLLAADKHEKYAFGEEPRYHSASNELKQQVTSLVNELNHKQKCLDDEKTHYKQVMQANDDLQQKVKLYHNELIKAREEAQGYINTIHAELKRKDTMFQTEKQKAMHEKLEKDKLKEELAALQTKNSKLEAEWKMLHTHRKSFQEKEDRYVAEILSAEEAIEAKDIEKKKSETAAAKLKNELAFAKEQIKQCERDFREERKAREDMHNEKGILQAKIDDVMRENKKMEEELQNFHRAQLHQSNRYRPAQPQYPMPRYERGGAEFFGPRRQDYEMPAEDEAGSLEPNILASYQNQEYYPGLRQPQQATTAPSVAWCPKCQQTFPDFDTLNIHITECID